MHIMVKSNLMALVLLSAQSSFAGGMGAHMTPYEGIYLGADIGISNIINSTSTTNPLAAHHMSATGIIGGGLVGYDLSLTQHIKLGVEGFGNATDLNMSSLQLYYPAVGYRVSSKYNAGARILPGYQLNGGSVVHVLLGYTNTRLNVYDNGNYGFINQKSNINGFQGGLGTKVPLTKHLSLRADALYNIYGHASNTGVSNVAPYGPQVYRNNVSALEGDLTLLYKFN